MNAHRRMRLALVAAAAGAMLTPAAAVAHVTVQPSELPAGGFTRLNVRVPNERPDADTTKVAVRMPAGFYFVNYEPRPGWKVDVQMQKLATPVEQFGEKVTEQVRQVRQVTFSSQDPKKGIAPGQFVDFGLSAGPVPDEPGSVLSFPALQTYSNGEVVRWIAKDPEAEAPAATAQLVKANANGVPIPPAAASPSQGRTTAATSRRRAWASPRSSSVGWACWSARLP